LSDFFKIDNTLNLEIGRLLLSEPLSDDDYFGRSVVLLTEYSKKQGSVGFVLNKKSDYALSDLVEDIQMDFSVYKGGPVEPNTLHYIHTKKEIKGALPIVDEIFWGGDFEQVKEWINLGLITQNEIQFFMGYSGWSARQLEEELKQNFWLIMALSNSKDIFNHTEAFWKSCIRNLGDTYSSWLNVPDNPSLN
jgi:putative transcriptional regulator